MSSRTDFFFFFFFSSSTHTHTHKRKVHSGLTKEGSSIDAIKLISKACSLTNSFHLKNILTEKPLDSHNISFQSRNSSQNYGKKNTPCSAAKPIGPGPATSLLSVVMFYPYSQCVHQPSLSSSNPSAGSSTFYNRKATIQQFKFIQERYLILGFFFYKINVDKP